MENTNLKKLLDGINVQADWIGLRQVFESTTYRIIRDDKPQANQRDATHGVMIEVLVNGQFGYYGVNSFDPLRIQAAAEKAVKQAQLASKYSIHSFTDKVRPAAIGKYQSPYEKSQALMSAGDLNDILMKGCAKLNVSDKIVSRSAFARLVDCKSNFVSTNGSDVEQKYTIISCDFTATAQDGPIIQKRTDHGMLARSYQAGMEVFDENEILERCEKIGNQSVELLSAEECPTESTSLVLSPDQMLLQIHESVGHALEIDRILGDERNYAGWSFVRLEDFGNLQYGSKLMNISFDPTVENQLASYAFDDGGMKAEKEYIVRNGLLVRGLGGMESQTRSGLPGVANFRSSSWNRAPIDRMANLNLEPGDSSFDDIIGSVEHGVYMESNRSWSIDDYRNKFQFGCEYGKLIENGKLTKTLRNPNYRAITNPFWNSLKMVGNRDTFGIYGTPYCGKGEPNQVIRVGHASPLALFENIEIFGGA
ncbi:MAG: TldD/PmbA family protein [Candidatus Marinimicrobia bacterium]|jgi:predicted Zn-dependent protease|nr:TldD/PmbA family protein [Candidatus Neomarinimicrobiota bacterium]MBT3633734.1 TldD/PmbA family protein [Candidatus Neomarinimicrobiota bacterium]MBT3682526.1 TldD/PmbA family protein [Candidatus Neomarinimicrobiota bacterium]MBT3759290.1 TldD/PmbA family protein [Candidatus Neomarinimicrobiota bacterium]MBT3894702.1 TldD/PmbA family protein [Candidatus Neomarinimicrobiota bacterium]